MATATRGMIILDWMASGAIERERCPRITHKRAYTTMKCH